uniref:Uncharacterized protein n=1 Tax=Eucampia antarctica TaxID=49252 RepID=A0A7S2S3Y4_9STRA|mmetsp:Transcript_30737/g.29611  ORF Transcript_30737/g.29611 Transcript_30737/m.29611 type:complete len:162 (+) Transcript_30737:98-583(+)|eukprot:CAMPEP_0197831294 /NCGR_PEP_ID=MMETSP1437-20131217/9005_1 /TAXON_ID=49252 ORGANISM="Eucampia antarctica, Strain CCMP1452" /NCGR_SAMPLE_ID=MMETSP1437 /ASSEMBLY_ACC=CAM_ASM_001096 /LENGTH=161 /DNA_ID=CAMNT_0043434149 /DNA_START=93 /DNA_END=578 /DNA_ORIENTATION=+
MNRLTIALAFLCVAVSSAFTVPSTIKHFALKSTALNGLMTRDEMDVIINKGHHCEEGECSIDDVSDLISQLQDQQHLLSDRIKEMDTMIKSLDNSNENDSRNVDEVRETVRSIFRLFAISDQASGNDYPSLSRPTGFSGEVGDGPTDAYKSLNPKPWKPSP